MTSPLIQELDPVALARLATSLGIETHGYSPDNLALLQFTGPDLVRFVAAAARQLVQVEREQCAVTAWNHFMDTAVSKGLRATNVGDWCAASAIRGRGVI